MDLVIDDERMRRPLCLPGGRPALYKNASHANSECGIRLGAADGS